MAHAKHLRAGATSEGSRDRSAEQGKSYFDHLREVSSEDPKVQQDINKAEETWKRRQQGARTD